MTSLTSNDVIVGGNCENILICNRSYLLKVFLVLSYLFPTDPHAVAINDTKSPLVAMETATVQHYPSVTKT